ncbi:MULTISPECIES: STAS domain-containing protein [unclassified Streptomyces]|uniref:STAS domain-containing protein n=1 Tax=unclassified Streptomyces TaxID=2593676 RepID=UPI00165652F3|nr:STAS domain-containing protein [Streptomyces sp. CB02980]MCB8901045.1 STAS domain-containing protein [Streptomyces sp. CB02980]
MPVSKEHTPDTPIAAGAPHVVWVRGDMDLDHAEELRASLMAAVAEAPRGADIIVDLQNSSFCDSSGLNALLAARQEAAESGHHLRLAVPSHQMVRLLESTGAMGLFVLGPAVSD